MSNPEVQKGYQAFTAMVGEQIARTESAFRDAGAFEQKGAEQARALADEYARLARASIDYSVKLSEDWRKASLEAARRAVELFTPKP